MRRHITALLGLFTLSAAAVAAPITYTFSGTADGEVDGVPFSGQTYTFIVTGETTAVTSAGDDFFNTLTGGVVTISGTACSAGCAIDTPSDYRIADEDIDVVRGIQLSALPNTWIFEGCFDCGDGTKHDLASNRSTETTGDQGEITPYAPIATSAGPVSFEGSSLGPISYRAAAASPIPALSFWNLLLLAALLGCSSVVVRRRGH